MMDDLSEIVTSTHRGHVRSEHCECCWVALYISSLCVQCLLLSTSPHKESYGI